MVVTIELTGDARGHHDPTGHNGSGRIPAIFRQWSRLGHGIAEINKRGAHKGLLVDPEIVEQFTKLGRVQLRIAPDVGGKAEQRCLIYGDALIDR